MLHDRPCKSFLNTPLAHDAVWLVYSSSGTATLPHCHSQKALFGKEKSLNWSDLDKETFMIIRSSDTAVLNKMRDDMSENHPQIKIADVSNFYNTSIFNECERMNYLMETLGIWADIHPSLVTRPMEWDYKIPYGIVYAKSPSKAVHDFIAVVQKSIPCG